MEKQSLKVLEIPLSKFTEEIIPHYQEKYDKHKVLIHKLLTEDNIKELHKEITSIKKAMIQLKDLMYELESLRSQVEDGDIVKFDSKTLGPRKSIETLMVGYRELCRISQEFLDKDMKSNLESADPFEGACQIQLLENLDDLKLQEYDRKCKKIEALNEDVNALHDMFGQLNEMVQHQDESIEDIGENLQTTSNNVKAGVKHLQVAHRLKTTAYPMTGAVLGGVMAGPIGMVAGAKIGGLAALCCAFLGYTGGKFFKYANEEVILESSLKDATQPLESHSDDAKRIDVIT